eukprot:6213650-Pleurochrysis_carterae.AAC.3
MRRQQECARCRAISVDVKRLYLAIQPHLALNQLRNAVRCAAPSRSAALSASAAARTLTMTIRGLQPAGRARRGASIAQRRCGRRCGRRRCRALPEWARWPNGRPPGTACSRGRSSGGGSILHGRSATVGGQAGRRQCWCVCARVRARV